MRNPDYPIESPTAHCGYGMKLTKEQAEQVANPIWLRTLYGAPEDPKRKRPYDFYEGELEKWLKETEKFAPPFVLVSGPKMTEVNDRFWVVFPVRFHNQVYLGDAPSRVPMNLMHAESLEAYSTVKRLFTEAGWEIDYARWGFWLIASEE